MDGEFDPDTVLKDGDLRLPAPRYDPSYKHFHSAAVAPKTVAATGKRLRDMCISVVASRIDAVESLANIPWSIAAEIYLLVVNPSAATLVMFMSDFPVEFAVLNSHLVFRNYKINKNLADNLQDAWFAFFLRSLDLSGTDFSDDMCFGIAKLENLKLLDISSTNISNLGLRNLTRLMIHAEKDAISGLPQQGLRSLEYLNLSMCHKLEGGKGLDDIINCFPSLLALGLNRTYIQRTSFVKNMIEKHGWIRIKNEVNVFPGFRGNVQLEAKPTSPLNTSAACLNSPTITLVPQAKISAIQSNKFFGNSSYEATLKQQKETFFMKSCFKKDAEISHNACMQIPANYRCVIENAWSLLFILNNSIEICQATFEPPLGEASVCDINETLRPLEPYNDLYNVVVGMGTLERNNSMAPWYLPFNKAQFMPEDTAAIEEIITKIVDAEIYGRLCIIRSHIQRDQELKKVVKALNEDKISRAMFKASEISETAAKLAEIKKKCAKRMEPSPKVVSTSIKRAKVESTAIPDFSEFLSQNSGKGGIISFGSQSALAGSGLFKMLSRKK
ncbi:hypothetical protein HK100_000467 [Physocladia obscura]|uniref:Uncharacterized protein n=1 Tax=Physocladia obscura TaxID=109957 RepID=A0AAD5SY85_9FUNG|nr:hypothetical protein HK100_000467 [Physocladia obscura]